MNKVRAILTFGKSFGKKYYPLIFLTFAYTFLFSYLSIQRHNAFASGFDLSNMDQTIWNTLHGRFFALTTPTGTVSRFSIHGDIFLIFFSPLYLLWDNVRAILVAQSFLLGLGVFPVFFLAKKILKNTWLAYVMVLVYLFNPGMQWTNVYDFHAVVFAIPLLLSAFYFAYTKQWKWYFVFIILAMMTKEEIPLEVAMLGFVVAVVFRNWKVGLSTFFLGLAWTFVVVVLIIPHFNTQHTYSFFSWYRLTETDSVSAGILNLPSYLFYNYFSNPDDINYYIILLKEYAFLPILGLPWLILSLPDLVINLLSTHAQMRSIFFQYDSGIIPGLMISSIFGVSYVQWVIRKISFTKKYATPIIAIFAVWALLFVIRTSYGHSPLPGTPSCWCVMYQPTNQDQQFEAVLMKIPQSASITASPEIRPHLTHRENAYTLPDATSSADFIAIIDQNRIVGDYGPKTFELALMQQLHAGNLYTLVSHIGHFYLYENKKYGMRI